MTPLCRPRAPSPLGRLSLAVFASVAAGCFNPSNSVAGGDTDEPTSASDGSTADSPDSDGTSTGPAETTISSNTTTSADTTDESESGGPAVCGNGMQESGEECDDGDRINTNDCTNACDLAACGDGILHEGVEECEDGNADSRDGCDAVCTVETQLFAGPYHTCALKEGALRCWGPNEDGRLGYDSPQDVGDNESPASAGDVPVGGTVVDVSIGWYATCALLNSGTVRCWGGNPFGQLGIDSIAGVSSADDAIDATVGAAVSSISAYGGQNCATLEAGPPRCWGFNASGQLGVDSTVAVSDGTGPTIAMSPLQIGVVVEQIATGGTFSCAIVAGGGVRCWGSGENGRLGYGNEASVSTSNTNTLSRVGDIDMGGDVVFIDSGESHTCALLEGGVVRCWGDGGSGELGYGNAQNVGDDETPAAAGDVHVGGTVVQLSVGSGHTCAVLEEGSVRCWGDADDGELGYGTAVTDPLATPETNGDVPVGGNVTHVVAGADHTCARLEGDIIRCWGRNSGGELGYGHTVNVGSTPGNLPEDAGDVDVF